jgi:hypothetical protein
MLQGQLGMTGVLAATWWTRPPELGKCLEVPGRFYFCHKCSAEDFFEEKNLRDRILLPGMVKRHPELGAGIASGYRRREQGCFLHG